MAFKPYCYYCFLALFYKLLSTYYKEQEFLKIIFSDWVCHTIILDPPIRIEEGGRSCRPKKLRVGECFCQKIYSLSLAA